jgi:hypothetical protein
MLKFCKYHFFIAFLSLMLTCLFWSCEKSGETGSLKWVLKNGTLTISGQGEMPNYNYKSGYKSDPPWSDYPNISSVVIEEGVTTIGDDAFNEYNNITSIIIPDTVLSIGKRAFENCKGLTSVTLGKSVKSIDVSAFDGCDNIRSGASTDSVKDGRTGPLSWKIDDGILFINGNGEMPNYETYQTPWLRHIFEISSIIINDGVTTIGKNAFYGCQNMVSVSISASVIEIGSDAFNKCRQLSTITLPSGLMELGYSVFMGCDNLLVINNLNQAPFRRETVAGVSYTDEEKEYMEMVEEWLIEVFAPTFPNKTYNSGTLYVPKQSIQAYKEAPMWGNFKNIQPLP